MASSSALEDTDAGGSDEPPVRVGRLVFNDGTQVHLEPGHVVVLVGANNVGKSSALQDISSELRAQPRAGHKVVQSVQIEHAEGHPAPLVAWVRERFPRFRPNPGDSFVYGTAQATVNQSQLEEPTLNQNIITRFNV